MKCSQTYRPALPLSDAKSRFIGTFCLLPFLLLLPSSALANSAPVVSNVRASQRGDDSKLVDIYYNLADADGNACTVWILISDNGGVNWRVPADSFSGAVGNGIAPGTNKHIVWDAGHDMPGKSGSFKIRVYADDGNGSESMVIVPGGWFGYQGASEENYIFVDSFMIDKYEVTVGAYCQFLNDNDPEGSHWHSGQEIIRKGNAGNYYYELQEGRDNYPVGYVSFYNAEAYAAWKSAKSGKNYRLPTEQEWQKAAAWDPVLKKLWTYGFQRDSIDSTWCNYDNAYGGPLPVGSFNGTDGKKDAKSYYGCYDMSGNLGEWTSSIEGGSSCVLRGGYWVGSPYYCQVVIRVPSPPSNRGNYIGFRLLLDF